MEEVIVFLPSKYTWKPLDIIAKLLIILFDADFLSDHISNIYKNLFLQLHDDKHIDINKLDGWYKMVDWAVFAVKAFM